MMGNKDRMIMDTGEGESCKNRWINLPKREWYTALNFSNFEVEDRSQREREKCKGSDVPWNGG